jgi:uncharacterized protein YuzE
VSTGISSVIEELHETPGRTHVMNVTVGETTFDRVHYDADADTLYLHVGKPSQAVDFDKSPEGHALRFNADGDLVGFTIVNAKRLLDGAVPIVVTIPETDHHRSLDACPGSGPPTAASGAEVRPQYAEPDAANQRSPRAKGRRPGMTGRRPRGRPRRAKAVTRISSAMFPHAYDADHEHAARGW